MPFGTDQPTRTSQDLVALAEQKGAKLLSLLHIGGDGALKVLDFAPCDPAHLKRILDGGERADGSSLFPGTGIETGASDVLLRPRLETAFFDPFAQVTTLCVFCSHTTPDGSPLPESPDTIVRRAYHHLQEKTGVDLFALGEVEFFLGRKYQEGDAHAAAERGYHAAAPMVFGQSLRRQALAMLAEMGVPIKYAHSEVGHINDHSGDGCIWEQHEIELGLAPLPRAAEAVALTQWVLRNLAQASGMRISFDPFLREGHASSGLHFHFSPRLNNKPLAWGKPGDPLPEAAQWLIGGLVQHAGALMAFGNRRADSFVRLTQGKEAPSRVTWGRRDRRALVRIPALVFTETGEPISTPTIEFRLPDGSAHSYFLLAGIAQAMVAGSKTPQLAKLLEQTSTVKEGKGKRAERLPGSLPEVAELLEQQQAVFVEGGVFSARWLELLTETLRNPHPEQNLPGS